MTRVRNLIGAGGHLLLAGVALEGLALIVRPWLTWPISLATVVQVLLTVSCVAACLLGVLWFHRSLDLIDVHLKDGKNELVTRGPFAYVRHPLYATLLTTIPPLLIIWTSDLLFLISWIVLLLVSHPLVRSEERGLVDEFGRDYERYREVVPALIPYKGAAGNRFRQKREVPGSALDEQSGVLP